MVQLGLKLEIQTPSVVHSAWIFLGNVFVPNWMSLLPPVCLFVVGFFSFLICFLPATELLHVLLCCFPFCENCTSSDFQERWILRKEERMKNRRW